MESQNALLFLALQSRLQSILITPAEGEDPVSALRLVDQEFGQMENHNGDNRPPVSWPVALIDLDNISFRDMSNNTQTGVMTVIIRIGFPPYSRTDSLMPAKYKNKALYYYELENAVHKSLQGWAPGEVEVLPATGTEDAVVADLSNVWGSMDRASARTEERSDLIRVRVLTYTIAMDDYSTKPAITWVPVTPQITTEFILPE